MAKTPKQTRIVLRDSLAEQTENLRKVTNANNLAEVVYLLVSRYGKHLEANWEINPGEKISNP